jgi:Alginate export
VTRILLALAAVLLATARVSAADADTLKDFRQTIDEVLRSHYEVGPARTLSESLRLASGAYTTFAYLSADDMTGEARGFSEIDARFWMRAETRGHTFYGRLRLQYDNYDSGDVFTASGDGLIEPLFDRYWYRFDWRQDERAESGVDPGWNWWVQVGRQYVNWLSGLTLSDPLHAVRAGVEARSVAGELLLGLSPNHFIDFDASRPGFDSDTERYFWGGSVECRAMRNHRPFLYFLAQEDENSQPFGPVGPQYHYNSRYAGAGSTGEISTGVWLYRLELVYEFGDSNSNALAPPQVSDEIQAYAGRFYIAYLPPKARAQMGLRVEAEVLVGSGDDDRGSSSQTVGGNLAGTKDQSFLAFGYVNTGLALAPELSNLVSVRFTGSAFPLRGRGIFDKMQVSLSGFVFAKYDDNAPNSVPTVLGESFIGSEIDLMIDWKLTSDLDLIAQYGIFLPGDAIADSDPLHFFYVGFSYGF